MINKAGFFYLLKDISRSSVRRQFQIGKVRRSMSNMSSPEEVKIPIPYGHIAAELWNGSSDETPIVALHGWLDNAGSWDTVIPLINRRFPILAIDLPGHGLSSPRPFGTGGSFFDHVAAFDRVVNHFKWEEIILLGHSMGASLAAMYAGTVPEKISKTILIEGGIPMICEYKDMPRRTAKYFKEVLLAEEKLKTNPPAYSYEDIIERLMSSHTGEITIDSAKCILRRGSKKNSSGNHFFTYSPLERVSFPVGLSNGAVNSYCSRINCDVLVVKGMPGGNFGERYRLYMKEGIDVIKKNAKSFQSIGLKGTHHLHLNDPIPIANAINKFVTGEPQNADDLIDLDDI